jgi:transposase
VKAARDAWHPELLDACVKPDDIVVLDEFGSTTQMTRSCGRCPVGERLVAPVPHGHWKVLTTIAAMTTQGMLAAVTVDAATDADVFRAFVRDALVPVLRPGQLVVMDNLSSHKAAGVATLIEAAGCRVKYLPPYSPDYNPIENAFAKIKARLKDLAARTVESLRRAVEDAVARITGPDSLGFFRHCGYVATTS